MTPELVERAVAILRHNRYLVLSTHDEDGPWAATVAYTAFAPNHLYFISQRGSRHGTAISAEPRVAGVIYNSQATGVEVDSIQFSGRAFEKEKDPAEMRRVLGRASEVTGSPNLTPEEEQELLAGEDTALYRIEVEQTFLLDAEAWEQRRVDARVEVDAREAFRRYEEQL